MVFDLRDRFGLRLSDVEGFPASEAFALLNGLRRDSRTHFYAAVTDQTFPGSHADAAIVLLSQGVMNMGRKRSELISLPGPYFGYAERKKREGAKVAPKVKQELTARLRKYSAIPD